MVVIRLARRGRKKLALYDIVAAEKRAPRDGKFLEKLGTYNPMTKPSNVKLYYDKIYKRLRVGAQPSPTVRSILSHAGILTKLYIQKGVDKKLFTQEEGDKRYSAWEENHRKKPIPFTFL